ncbi:MAG: DUF4390 domain-containing protein [Candidatus Dadabacteria bacterium]|nr:DUF4390 domain-containing protein [Candidatus Dadabacteria bacterium]
MKSRIAILFIFCYLAGASWAFAQNVFIDNVVITKYQNSLYVYFKLEGPFSVEMQEAIKSGIKTTFTFYVVLKKHRGGILSDPEITERTIKHSIKYNALLKEYAVTRDEEGAKPFVTKDFETAKRIMAQVRFYPLAPLTMLEKGGSYRIEIKGELDKDDIPQSLRYVFFFSKAWSFSTPWYVEGFSY